MMAKTVKLNKDNVREISVKSKEEGLSLLKTDGDKITYDFPLERVSQENELKNSLIQQHLTTLLTSGKELKIEADYEEKQEKFIVRTFEEEKEEPKKEEKVTPKVDNKQAPSQRRRNNNNRNKNTGGKK